MKRFRAFFLSIVAALAAVSFEAEAQVVVNARLDTALIRIGEQVQLTVKCNAGAKQRVDFPQFAPTEELAPGVEVVSAGAVDTLVQSGGKRYELTRRYTITSFDSAVYTLPPIAVLVDGKSYKSRQQLGLKVNTVPVDTVHLDRFPGPHAAVMPAFVWQPKQLAMSLLVLSLLVVAAALAVRLSDKRPITKRVVIAPPTPPHIPAVSKIEELKQTMTEDTKAYYMRLTDTLRTYIEQRFGINAREMTTAEIVDHLTAEGNLEALRELKNVLITADLVKFAKFETSVAEQDKSWVEALDFVRATKLEPVEQPKPRVEYVSLDARNQTRIHRAYVALFIVSVLATTSLLGLTLKELQNSYL